MTHFVTFESAADQFPLDPSVCYLNHAAVSPWPRCAKEALDQFSEENVTLGATHYPKWLKVEQSLRERLKALINASSTKEIALAKNTSEALSIIAYGLDWQAGDEIVISDQEFPSNRIVWESLERFGVTLKQAHLSTDDPEGSVLALINSKTRLVSLSSVQYASGLALDLPRISEACKQANALFCVDAIQSLGAIPFDQQTVDADFIVADGHKWMMAAEGLALLYVKHSVQNQLDLKQYGWHMVEHRGNYDLKSWAPAPDATRFECGSPNMLGIHTLSASLGLLLDIGIEEIHKAIIQRVAFLEEELSRLPGVKLLSPRLIQQENSTHKNEKIRSGIVTFAVDSMDSADLHRQLMKQGVICANRGGGIRLSPHFYTTKETLSKALNIIKASLHHS